MLDSLPGARKITTEVIPIAVTSELEEAKLLLSLLSDLGKFYNCRNISILNVEDNY